MTLWEFAQPRTLDDKFRQWLLTTNGRRVKAEVAHRALLLRRRGVAHYGIGAIFESIRFDYAAGLLGKDPEGYRLNNNYRSRLARLLADEHPELRGFFEERRLRS